MKIQLALALAFLALAPVAATAETQEEQDACMNDAFTICGDAIPDRNKVGACLAHNISRISPACRTVMLRYQKPETTAAASRPATSATVAKATHPSHLSKGPLNIKPKLSASRSASRS